MWGLKLLPNKITSQSLSHYALIGITAWLVEGDSYLVTKVVCDCGIRREMNGPIKMKACIEGIIDHRGETKKHPKTMRDHKSMELCGGLLQSCI